MAPHTPTLSNSPDARFPHHLEARFDTTFGGAPQVIAFAPGRINLIGEHTDYVGGTVLPMTIQRGTWFAARRTHAGRLRARSDNYHGLFDAALPCSAEAADDTPWARYLVGVQQLLAEQGIALPGGLDVFITGDLPTGGLSSSASLCVGFALCIEALTGHTLAGGRPALARLCQRVEHEFAQVQCGIMDQAVIAMSIADHALALNCQNLEFEHVAVPSTTPCWMVLDSGVPRALADAPYNIRQDEARQAEARLLPVARVANLCSIAEADLPALANDPRVRLDAVLLRRARHCVGEQARVHTAIAALRAQDWHALGAAMSASHASLRDDFEVSCPELDLLVSSACATPGVYGARLTGAGFGGAAIALVDADALPAASAAIGHAFAAVFGRTPATFPVHAGGGARLLQAPA